MTAADVLYRLPSGELRFRCYALAQLSVVERTRLAVMLCEAAPPAEAQLTRSPLPENPNPDTKNG